MAVRNKSIFIVFNFLDKKSEKGRSIIKNIQEFYFYFEVENKVDIDIARALTAPESD